LYFDGRKDKTKKQVAKGKKYHPTTVTEEHIVLVSEPGDEYMGHVTPSTGKSMDLKNSIVEFLSQNDINTEQLVAIGCDGTNVNTGCEGGVIRLLELHCNKPLHWFVCLLHMNELPLRHLFIHIDGVTHGPSSFSGQVGKSLSNFCLRVVDFEPVEGNELKLASCSDLSDDQRYLADMWSAVTSGKCSVDVANRQPGPMAHSRWLTTASRILRLYIGTVKPGENLKTLVKYIVRVYVPVWFEIKSSPRCTDGARHLWKLINYSRYLAGELREIVDAVIQRNAYFAHPENILLAMMSDERPNIRKLAIKRVLAARADTSTTATIRAFKVPSLIFGVTDYYEMIDWSSIQRLEPPLTRDMEQELLQTYSDMKTVTPIITFPNLPCHTQAVERCIRLVTEACVAVCESQRDGFIRSRIESRSVMQSFDKKADYRFK
jgi:hypothetical protein